MRKIIYLCPVLLLIAVFLSGCIGDSGLLFPPGNGTGFPDDQLGTDENISNGFLNDPPATLCLSRGYKYQILDNPDGTKTAFCVFNDGKKCEAWDYFRGYCDENSIKKAKLGEMCGGIAGILCEYGLRCRMDGNYPDASGICAKSGYEDCPQTRMKICTMEFDPVCGKIGETPSTLEYRDFGNPCVACSQSGNALGYSYGTCKENGLSSNPKKSGVLYACPSNRFENCSDEYDPVCGRVVSNDALPMYFTDYRNPCLACSKHQGNAIGYFIGTCQKQ